MIRGDQSIPVVSAASILAKVSRDRQMVWLDRAYRILGISLSIVCLPQKTPTQLAGMRSSSRRLEPAMETSSPWTLTAVV